MTAAIVIRGGTVYDGTGAPGVLTGAEISPRANWFRAFSKCGGLGKLPTVVVQSPRGMINLRSPMRGARPR